VVLLLPDSVVSNAFPELGVLCEVNMFVVEVEEAVGMQLAAISWEINALFFWMFNRGNPSFFPRNDCRGCVVGIGLGRFDRDPFSYCPLMSGGWAGLGMMEGRGFPKAVSNLWSGIGGSGR
jgi:hypothetical protein